VVWVPDENVHSADSSQLTENLKPDQVLRLLETSSFVPEEWGLPPFDDSLASQETARETGYHRTYRRFNLSDHYRCSAFCAHHVAHCVASLGII